MAGAGVVAGIALMVVYMGLTYLGATTAHFFDLTVNRTYLVTAIVRNLMGQGGTVLFAIVVALACITTAVALVSSAADFFPHSPAEKSPIGFWWSFLCVQRCGVQLRSGPDHLHCLPILDIVYPPHAGADPAGVFQQPYPQRLGLSSGHAGRTAVQCFERAQKHVRRTLGFLDYLPLSSLGFGWLLPSLVLGAIGFLLPRRHLFQPGLSGTGPLIRYVKKRSAENRGALFHCIYNDCMGGDSFGCQQADFTAIERAKLDRIQTCKSLWPLSSQQYLIFSSEIQFRQSLRSKPFAAVLVLP